MCGGQIVKHVLQYRNLHDWEGKMTCPFLALLRKTMVMEETAILLKNMM